MSAQGQAPQGPVVTIGNLPLPVTGTVADLGQNPSLVVNLRFFNNAPARRINSATGHAVNDPFVVPAGHVLVLTDVRECRLCARDQRPSSVAPQRYRWRRERQADFTFSGTGDATYGRHNTTGLIFAAGSTIHAAMSPVDFNNHFAFAQGYLVPTD